MTLTFNTQPNLYSYPKVGRFGLGHSLLAWARCVVWSNQNGAQRIAPHWLQPRLGPYIRRERDKRFYYSQFRAGAQVAGIKRLQVLATAQRIRIEEWHDGQILSKPTIVIFENLPTKNEVNYLHEIIGHSGLVREALWDMTMPYALPKPIAQDYVAIHVRGGDFLSVVDPEKYLTGTHNLRLPTTWYIDMLLDLRRQLGKNIPAIVYSDCTDQEIEILLNLPKVARAKKMVAVADMLSMSQAPVLISSGSNFSRWATYLGQVPRICYPGQRSYRMIEGDSEIELEPECAHEIPADFVASLQQRFKSTFQPEYAFPHTI